MNLFIGNLNPETTEQNLRDIFSEYGAITSVKIIMDNETGLPKGFGFVEMEQKFDAFDAIDNIDMIYFMGNIINVREAKSNKTGGNNRRGSKSQNSFSRNSDGRYFKRHDYNNTNPE